MTAFLACAAEPKMMARKRMRFTAVALSALLSVLLHLTNKKVRAPVKRQRRE